MNQRTAIIQASIIASGVALAGIAALAFGTAVPKPEPLSQSAQTPCDVRPHAKENRCPTSAP